VAKTCIPVFLVATLALGACAAEDPSLEEEASGTVADGRGDASENFVFYSLRPDLRRCAAPRCGGYFVKAVNLTVTRCADGSYAPECYVPALDLSKLALSADAERRVRDAVQYDRLLVRGAIHVDLQASEAWVAITKNRADGQFARVTGTGIVCVAAPCPTLHAGVLNTKGEQDLGGLDFSDLPPQQADLAYAALSDPRGILIAGKTTRITGPAGELPGYHVLQAYLHVTP